MTSLNVQLPANQMAQLQSIAVDMGLNLQSWIQQLTTAAISEWEQYNSFKARAIKGDAAVGLSVLDELRTK